jgi:hypothetical protein
VSRDAAAYQLELRDGVNKVLQRVREHHFHPLDSTSFTIDRELKQHGIADLGDDDWKARLLAVRDLVRAGKDAAGILAEGLSDSSPPIVEGRM